MANLVRSICCGPPTTTPSESDCSIGKNIATDQRNRLSDERFERLTFLKRNLSKEYA